MKTDKRPQFKRGDRVLYYSTSSYGIHLTEATVTAVRQDDQHWIVHTLFKGERGSEWRKRFTTGQRYRGNGKGFDDLIETLRLLTDVDDLENLKKRAATATDRYRRHQDKVSEVQRQVEHEAYDWRVEETRRRTETIPDGFDYVNRVLSRMGFRRPRLT